MTSLLAAALGVCDDVVAGLIESGGAAVALPCAAARRSRLLPGVSGDCSCVGRKLFSRRDLNETVFALNYPGDWWY